MLWTWQVRWDLTVRCRNICIGIQWIRIEVSCFIFSRQWGVRDVMIMCVRDTELHRSDDHEEAALGHVLDEPLTDEWSSIHLFLMNSSECVSAECLLRAVMCLLQRLQPTRKMRLFECCRNGPGAHWTLRPSERETQLRHTEILFSLSLSGFFGLDVCFWLSNMGFLIASRVGRVI